MASDDQGRKQGLLRQCGSRLGNGNYILRGYPHAGLALPSTEDHAALCAVRVGTGSKSCADNWRLDSHGHSCTAAQHSACPSESAMQALLELVAYLITTKSWGIRASLEDTPETTQLRNEEETCQPDNPWAHFSDTDHAGNREIQNKRRSQNCYIACHRGMPVYWKSSVGQRQVI